jgi:hypothetical protein
MNNLCKIIHDYGRTKEEINREYHHDSISYSRSTFHIHKGRLHSIPPINNVNISTALDVYKEYLNISIIEIFNKVHFDTSYKNIALYNVVFKVISFKITLGKIS